MRRGSYLDGILARRGAGSWPGPGGGVPSAERSTSLPGLGELPQVVQVQGPSVFQYGGRARTSQVPAEAVVALCPVTSWM